MDFPSRKVNNHSLERNGYVGEEGAGVSDFFDEGRMRRTLEKHLPAGETLLAGVHGIGMEVKIIETLPNCVYVEGVGLFPTPESKNILHITKEKHCKFDLYLGITEHYLLLAECEPNKWYYEFRNLKALTEFPSVEDAPLPSLEDIGTHFPFSFLQSCTVKKAWMGAVVCSVQTETGSSLKLMLPKRGGLGNGMPHHAEYRQAILDRLTALEK